MESFPGSMASSFSDLDKGYTAIWKTIDLPLGHRKKTSSSCVLRGAVVLLSAFTNSRGFSVSVRL